MFVPLFKYKMKYAITIAKNNKTNSNYFIVCDEMMIQLLIYIPVTEYSAMQRIDYYSLNFVLHIRLQWKNNYTCMF